MDSLVSLMNHDASDLGSLMLSAPKEHTQSVIIIDFRKSKQKDNLKTTEFDVRESS